jgi:hypothetical protein
MKFGRNLKKIVALSDPEWGPFWMNYNHLKRKIKREIAAHQGGSSSSSSSGGNDEVEVVDGVNPQDVIGRLLKSSAEVEFFRLLREELKKTDDFYKSAEEIFKIRLQRVRAAFEMLKSNPAGSDKNTWTRLLTACVKLYRDVLMLENYCIMNYCGFSKILKKHDKATGFRTRDPFMFNVMGAQSFTEYLSIQELLLVSEKLFTEIQQMEHCMPLQEEERLFIEAIRELNRQASKVQRNEGSGKDVEAGDAGHAGAGGSSGAGGGGSGSGGGGDSSDIDADELALHNAANAAVAAAQKASNSSTNSLKSMEGAKTNGGGKSPTVLPLVLAVPAPAAADAAANTATSRKRGTSTRDT